jgi:CheY-like chemotaxis protein
MSRGQVLVVDDDPWQRAHMVRQLTRLGYQPREAADAFEALDLLDEPPLPAAIVLDMLLPGPNGMTFLHEIRSHTDSADIPIIICSASVQNMDLGDLQPYGVVALLDKTTMLPGELSDALKAAGI